MPKLQINKQRPVRVRPGKSLLDILTRLGIGISAACGGKGECGSCRIKIKNPDRPTVADKRFISSSLLKHGYRLACQYHPIKDLQINVFAQKNTRIKLNMKCSLAIDLGTTVIKGAVIDSRSKKIIMTAKTYNLQNNYGADVITRISAAIDGKYDELRKMLIESIEVLKGHLKIDISDRTVVVGNPVMSSFFLNRSLDRLARHPFTSDVEKGFSQTDPPIFVFPAIAGFVGGDTLAGILATGLHKKSGVHLYIDLGTNGEVVLSDGKKIYVTSTAAGPAFEGVGISSGCLAIPGAVTRVIDNKNTLLFRTIAGRAPIGFCASGLIDLLAIALKRKWLLPDGRMRVPFKKKGLSLTQGDVRKLQLSISAIHTGIALLLEKAGVKAEKIKTITLSGEFGATLNPGALKKIGLLPAIRANVLAKPDLALKGALMVLKDSRLRGLLIAVKKKCIHVNIAQESSFEKTYLNSLRLAPWD